MPTIQLAVANSTTIDSGISKSSPDSLLYTNTVINVRGYGSTSEIIQYLLQFDFGLIPNDAIITSATLKLSVGGPVGKTVNLHKITSPWSDDVTWNKKPTYDSAVIASMTMDNAGNGVGPLNITSLVQSWVNGEKNYGILVASAPTNAVTDSFAVSTLDGTSDVRPILTINYTIPNPPKHVEHVGGTYGYTVNSATSLSVPMPSVSAGDFLLAYVIHKAGDAPIVPPTGWQTIRESKVTSTARVGFFSKIATGLEGTQVFNSNVETLWNGAISAFRNVNAMRESFRNTITSITKYFRPPDATTVYNDTLAFVVALTNAETIGSHGIPLSWMESVGMSAGLNGIQSMYKYMQGNKQVPGLEANVTFTDYGAGESVLFFLEPIQNRLPSLSLTGPSNSLQLTEGSNYQITGSVTDADNGNVVTIKYQINSNTARALHSAVSNGSTPIAFAKALIYRGGRLYDGSTDVSGLLAEGTTHTLSIWAEDDQGGKSTVATRSFTVKYNKAPVLTIDPLPATQTGLIPPDSLTITGTVSEPDGNTLTVKAKLNNRTEQTLPVSSGKWTITFKVSDLQVGANTVVITATDQFGSATVKTINVTNAVSEVPMIKGVARYKLTPPLGTTHEVLAWLQREKGDLSVDAAVSFVDTGQAEQYTAMTKESADVTPTIAEDELIATAGTAKANITMRVTLTKANATSTEAATMLVGVIS